MKKILVCFALLSALAISNADTVKLKNGDRITGSFSQTQFSNSTELYLDVKTRYGATISIPKADILAVISDSDAIKEAKVIAEATAPKQEEVKAPVVRTWEDDYKDFIHSIVPPGWEFRLRAGLEYKDTTTKNISYTFSFEGKTKWDDFNEFDFRTWYDYATEEPRNLPQTKSSDNYGIRTNYKRFLGKGDDWYLQNMLGYSVDRVKLIKDQVDAGILFGRRFRFFDEKMILNIALGPAVRYTNAVDYDHHWAMMGTLAEDFTWNMHKYSRIEQSAYFGLNLGDLDKYSFDFRLGVVFDITEIVSLALRYVYTYDNMTSADAQKSEQRLIIGLEIPFK